jgi:hypothetical protein
VDSRFSGVGDRINLYQLKHNSQLNVNPIDVCPGASSFHLEIAKEIGREKYCPFIQTSTDPRMCEWVHAIDNDTQKSKPVGQTAIVFEALNLTELQKTADGKVRALIWKPDAKRIKKYPWRSRELNQILISKTLEYGPVLGILNLARRVARNGKFNRSNILPLVTIPLTNDRVKIRCHCNQEYEIILPNGNTSLDAARRSVTALLCLAASTGFIAPDAESYETQPDSLSYPSYFYDWYLSKKNRLCPSKWIIDSERINEYMHNQAKIMRGIGYDNLIPKSTDRNLTSNCRNCNKNLVNLAKKQYGTKVKNRRLLLLEGLRISFENSKSLSLKELAKASCEYSNFYVNRNSQQAALMSDLQIANLTGFSIRQKKDLIMTETGAEEGAFNPIPVDIKRIILSIINQGNIFV